MPAKVPDSLLQEIASAVTATPPPSAHLDLSVTSLRPRGEVACSYGSIGAPADGSAVIPSLIRESKTYHVGLTGAVPAGAVAELEI